MVWWKGTTNSRCLEDGAVGRSWTAKSVRVSERKGIIPLNVAENIQMAALPKVRSALCAASQLPGEGPTDVEDAPQPDCDDDVLNIFPVNLHHSSFKHIFSIRVENSVDPDQMA